MASSPEVSICVPAYNTARWITRAVASALSQTYSSFELVVVDNASTDGTLERVQSVEDPRLRLYSNSHNLGQARNWNRALSLARGELIKFLCADDVLYPDCLEEMVALFRAHPNIGLVFSMRDVELERADDPAAVEWRAKHSRPHELLGDLHEVNSGPTLVRKWIDSGLARNAVGEPTNVMVSRECLRRVGTFGLRVRQRLDVDLWVRVMCACDVGFVGRPLARFLVRSESETNANRAGNLAWLDHLWLLEGLLADDDIRREWPQLAGLRRRAAARSVRHAIHRAMAGDWTKFGDLFDYARFHLRDRDRTRIVGSLDERYPPGETRPVATPAFRARRDDPRDDRVAAPGDGVEHTLHGDPPGR